MKKVKKIFLVSSASLLVILIFGMAILSWFVFTPERITPVIRNQAEKHLTCQTEIGEVELTFFRTFPHIGLKIDRVAFIHPVPDAPNDTLVYADRVVCTVDAAAWWKRKELIVTELKLIHGVIHAFTDSLGNSNYNILHPQDPDSGKEKGTGPMFRFVDLKNLELDDININYVDLSVKLMADIRNLTARIAGRINHDCIVANLRISRSGVTFALNGEQYLQDAILQCDIPAEVILPDQMITLKEASASVDGLEILLEGSFQADNKSKNIITNINYSLNSWRISDIFELLPASFNSYLHGFDAEGLLTSEGSISGILSDSSMPLMNLRLLLEDGKLKYAGFPLPINDIDCDAVFFSDLRTDSLSFIRISRLDVKTPESNINTKGMVNHLFGDIQFSLTSDAGLTLEEMNTIMPDSLTLNLSGHLSGHVLSDFTLSQISNMQIEKMKLSGSAILSDFSTVYDSVTIMTDRSVLEFEFPGHDKATKSTGFACATLSSDHLEAERIEGFHTSLKNSSVSLETSDFRDTTRIPDIICAFEMDSLTVLMDTLNFLVAKPKGKIAISDTGPSSGQSRIILSYDSEKLETNIGKNHASIDKISITGDVLNDNSREDVFLRWLANGSIEVEKGIVNLPELSYPLEIPSISMNFEPEALNIINSRIIIDKSDFQLTGNLNNVLSYFRGDSILRGNFSFVSSATDVSQLMSITSGIGNTDTTVTETPEKKDKDSSSYSGPYIVPQGMDILLSTNISKATFGIDTASDIKGSVRIYNGILLLDELRFNTPAARMQLTAMYRTPRKNHLFLGLDYHMLDVEIGELLTMIPDIDTLMPMLRSFGGKGEFHFAVEAYLDSLYNIKKSTLRGASSIQGNDLVLMDGETFSEIARTLRFNKKTENRVDSLSAEFTIFREEIDVYPFLIVMDKYKAVVAGRHNFDLSFDYHISVVDSPLPVKLGVDIKGNMEDLDYRLVGCRYAEFYRPASRHAVESRQLELRKMIRDALNQKVVDE